MKVVAVSGGSGGHLFPALAFLECLKTRYPDATCVLIVPQGTVAARVCPHTFSIEYLPLRKLQLACSWQTIAALLALLRSAIETVRILLRVRPDAVVGFGTIVSLPVVWGAWFFRIPTFIHEQNVLPGKATRFLSYFVDRIAVSFEESRRYLSDVARKIVYTGNPVRHSLVSLPRRQAADFFGFSPDVCTMLIMGGSQGSQAINRAALAWIVSVRDPGAVQVIHLCGRRDFDEVRRAYQATDIVHRVFEFLNEMQYAYSAADLVISRSGASTVTEIMHYALPAVLIPYPYARRHQRANADVLVTRGCAVMLEESRLNAQTLRDVLEPLRGDPLRRAQMKRNFSTARTREAADALCDMVSEWVNISI